MFKIYVYAETVIWSEQCKHTWEKEKKEYFIPMHSYFISMHSPFFTKNQDSATEEKSADKFSITMFAIYVGVFPKWNTESVTKDWKWKPGMMQNSLETYGRLTLKLMWQSRDQNWKPFSTLMPKIQKAEERYFLKISEIIKALIQRR